MLGIGEMTGYDPVLRHLYGILSYSFAIYSCSINNFIRSFSKRLYHLIPPHGNKDLRSLLNLFATFPILAVSFPRPKSNKIRVCCYAKGGVC